VGGLRRRCDCDPQVTKNTTHEDIFEHDSTVVEHKYNAVVECLLFCSQPNALSVLVLFCV
jgi:hypothetical protein